jgi:hypothetical protein
MQKLRNNLDENLKQAAAAENLDYNVNINRAWDNTKTSAKDSIGHYDLKQHKTWFDDEC